MNFKEFCISNKEKVKTQYKNIMGRPLNLENPKTLNEKIQWLKVYDSTFIKSFCADKILVADYVEEKLGKKITIPILGIYDKFEEIDFSKLPNDYVIKCNHGSGMNIIVKNGNVNKVDIKQKLDKWMNTDFSLKLFEFHYKPIKRKIFIEQYMRNSNKEALTDYKFYCFNGKPAFCQIMNDRFTNTYHLNYYDLDFNKLKEISQKEFPADYSKDDDKPKNWNLMIEYAKKLSEDFKFVRVDFYEINGNVYLGELTFTPAGGYMKYKNENTDLELGMLLKLN